MNFPRSTSAVRQQQQPARVMNRQQQQSGSNDFQPGVQQGGNRKTGQWGDGRREGARDYQNSIESYLKTANGKPGKPLDKPNNIKDITEQATPSAATTAG